jgi:hypothetical protein
MGTQLQSRFDDTAMWDAFHQFHYLCDKHRFKKLFARADLFRMVADLPGDIVDAGAFKGVSTIQWAHLLEAYQPNTRARVVAFDTFDATFPQVREDERASAEHHQTTYKEDAYETIVAALERLELKHRVEIVRGDIVKTMPQFIAERPGFRISLLHCDMDVYSPTLATLKACWPRVVSGGLVVFDEYAVNNWGESDAVDQFFKQIGVPVRLKTVASSPTPSAYLVKP